MGSHQEDLTFREKFSAIKPTYLIFAIFPLWLGVFWSVCGVVAAILFTCVLPVFFHRPFTEDDISFGFIFLAGPLLMMVAAVVGNFMIAYGGPFRKRVG